jgi:hypothetical protein
MKPLGAFAALAIGAYFKIEENNRRREEEYNEEARRRDLLTARGRVARLERELTEGPADERGSEKMRHLAQTLLQLGQSLLAEEDGTVLDPGEPAEGPFSSSSAPPPPPQPFHPPQPSPGRPPVQRADPASPTVAPCSPCEAARRAAEARRKAGLPEPTATPSTFTEEWRKVMEEKRLAEAVRQQAENPATSAMIEEMKKVLEEKSLDDAIVAWVRQVMAQGSFEEFEQAGAESPAFTSQVMRIFGGHDFRDTSLEEGLRRMRALAQMLLTDADRLASGEVPEESLKPEQKAAIDAGRKVLQMMQIAGADTMGAQLVVDSLTNLLHSIDTLRELPRAAEPLRDPATDLLRHLGAADEAIQAAGVQQILESYRMSLADMVRAANGKGPAEVVGAAT